MNFTETFQAAAMMAFKYSFNPLLKCPTELPCRTM